MNDLRASPPTPEPENLDQKCKVSGTRWFNGFVIDVQPMKYRVINVNHQSHIVDRVSFCRKAWRTSAAGEDSRWLCDDE